MIVKKAAMMIEAHESVQKLNRLYFAYVHQSVSVTTVTAGQQSPTILIFCSSSETGQEDYSIYCDCLLLA